MGVLDAAVTLAARGGPGSGRHQNLRGLDALRRVEDAGHVVVNRLVHALALLQSLGLVEHQVCRRGLHYR